eukprot:gene28163-37063_t
MATELSSVIKSLKHLENQNSSHKPQPRREDCQEEITEKNSPDTYNREKALMKKLRNINDSDVVDAMHRGVSIAFLVEFCKAFNLWDVSIIEVQRNFIRPMTGDTHCRFVDLPIMKGNKEFGDLVTSISDGADPKRKVWLDLLAFRQWQWCMANYFITIEYVIPRCPSFLVFCPDPAELSSPTIPAAVKAQVPFFRLWCLHQIYLALISNGVNIVVKCGHHKIRGATRGSSSAYFIPNRAFLEAVLNTVDIFSEGAVAFNSDKKVLMDKLNALPAGFADIDRMNAKLRGVVRAGVATYDDTLLHNAACGDLAAKHELIFEESENYIHKIATAGYISLLVEVLKLKPELASYVDPETRRTLLTSAVWGGSLDCVHFLLKNPETNIDSKDKFDKSALSYMRELNYSDLAEYFESFYIRHKNKDNQLYVCPDDTNDRSVKLVLQDFDPNAFESGEKERQFLFRFVGDQLQHVQSGKYVHPIHGHKGPDVSIRLYDDSDGERTSCYPFDYDPTRCLLAGGDNFFVEVNRSNELVWHKYGNTKDDKNPFDSKNGFEFEIISYVHGVNRCEAIQPDATIKPITDTLRIFDYHQECERAQMDGKVQEFLFPRSYLIDSVEERLPHNGKIKGIFKGGLCDKTIGSDSITQRMLLITANIETFEFSFGDNPWMTDMDVNLGFPQLLSFRLNELEVVSNCTGEADDKFEKLSVTLAKDHPYFDSIRVQCVLSLQNNPSNVKHICYLEVTAKNSTATLGGVQLPTNKDGKWSIGTQLPTTQETIGDTKVHVFEVEEVKGPLVFTGVGIDNYAGFLFQLARKESKVFSSIDEIKKALIDECFYEDYPRLTSADITHYNYFESQQKNQTGYREIGHYSTYIVRNLYRELALEVKDVAILFQKLNHLYPEYTTEPVPRVLPTMLDILERCFADNQIGLIQSVIRVNHIKSDDSMINQPVREIWSTFTETISMVKQFVLDKPKLNLIECAILSDNQWNKWKAIFIAFFQCLILYVTAVVFIEAFDDDDDNRCDIQSIYKDAWSQNSWVDSWGCVLKCYWRVDYSFMMTIIAVIVSYMKVKSQIQDQYKFYTILKPILKQKGPSAVNITLIFFDCFVNVIMSFCIILLIFHIMSLCDEAKELVQNCVGFTFIVELDEDLNDRDSDAVDKLVIQGFKNYLTIDMMHFQQKYGNWEMVESWKGNKWEEEPDLYSILDGFVNTDPPKAPSQKVHIEFVLSQLRNADYSSDSRSTKENSMVTEIVVCHMREGRLLPVLNDQFGGDPHTGKPKFLVLQFEDKLVSAREKLVVDFSVIEKMLRGDNEPNTPILVSKTVWKGLWDLISHIWQYSFILEWFVDSLWQCDASWLSTIVVSAAFVGSLLYLLSDVEFRVQSVFSRSNITSAIVLIHGQKYSMRLILDFQFGFLPLNHSILSAGKNNLFDGVCAGAVEMLSDRFWFDNVNVSQQQPFKFAGGCLLPPNQLVIQYEARQNNQTSDGYDDDGGGDNEKGDKGRAGAGECSSEEDSIFKLVTV